MVLTLGTNCGFVEAAPETDPNTGGYVIDDYCWGVLDTSPATATTITEIGWWCSTASSEANFEVGIYDDAGNNEPENRLEVDTTNAKGTTVGWKRVTGLNWSISSNTAYWLALQLDKVTTYTGVDYIESGGSGLAALFPSQTELPADWGTSGYTDTDGKLAIYAVWEAGGEPPYTSINIGDAWKSTSGAVHQINIGDAWKAVASAAVNIGDVWKTITLS